MDSLYNTNSQNFSNNTHQSFHDESTRYNNQTVQYQQTQDNYYQHDQYNYYYQTSYENYNNTQYSNYYYNNQTADFQSNMNYQYQYQSSNGYQTENNESNMMHFQHNSTTQYNYYQYAQHDQQSTQQYEIQAPIVINTINDNMNTEEICGVCENNKDVKFVYGGYLDEACLKFFQRCVKNEEKGKTFICKKDGYCIVTGDQRTKCGACRYNKCLSLGLSKTNRGYKITESIVRPCEICNGVSSGVHFGAFTCEACKTFFRKNWNKRGKDLNNIFDNIGNVNELICSKNEDCTMTAYGRKCPYCRLEKCFSVGMNQEKGKKGRIPNSEKFKRQSESDS